MCDFSTAALLAKTVLAMDSDRGFIDWYDFWNSEDEMFSTTFNYWIKVRPPTKLHTLIWRSVWGARETSFQGMKLNCMVGAMSKG